jgi:hypothetical protein
MEKRKGLSPLSALVIIIGIACATFIGYRIAQNKRYTPMKIGNLTMLWDNWKEEPVFKNGEIKELYDIYYK